MISFSEAQHLVIEHARSFGTEKVHLDDAFGRVLAQTVVADRDYPPFNRAAMDGYAIMQSDWNIGVRSFTIREVIYAGNVETLPIDHGECYKIMTGAAVPGSANTVIRKEDVIEEGSRIHCSELTVNIYQHVSRRGEDLKAGELVCSRPVLCSSAIIGMLASLGNLNVIVQKLPRISIITTGNEIVNVGEPVNAVEIRNSNIHVIKSLLKGMNIVPASFSHVRDNLREMEAALQGCLSHDMIIISGGVSAGDADYTPEALSNLGVKKIFHKVAIRPGKPIWFGKSDHGPTVFALPGNPFSCIVTFKLFIELYLSYCFGIGKPYQLELPVNGSRAKKTSLDEFFPVKISGTPSFAEAIPFNGSGDILASLNAHAIARHPGETGELQPGNVVDCLPIL